ncbi:hypothetical protein ACCO45_003249 [Purpureocillium lilacinum]|uniref:Uncharacterized protein n=1 Tax=Purpureocillium lilacinum TaxID=33203 RepID=A0ACC4DZC9_PURLI
MSTSLPMQPLALELHGRKPAGPRKLAAGCVSVSAQEVAAECRRATLSNHSSHMAPQPIFQPQPRAPDTGESPISRRSTPLLPPSCPASPTYCTVVPVVRGRPAQARAGCISYLGFPPLVPTAHEGHHNPASAYSSEHESAFLACALGHVRCTYEYDVLAASKGPAKSRVTDRRALAKASITAPSHLERLPGERCAHLLQDTDATQSDHLHAHTNLSNICKYVLRQGGAATFSAAEQLMLELVLASDFRVAEP